MTYKWQIGDPADWGDGFTTPDLPYMEYLDDSDYDDYYDSNNYADSKMEEAEKISYKAWNLRNENKYEEALVLTNQAIKLDPHHFNHLNRKGIILEDLRRYKESLNFYNKALSLKRTKTILNKSILHTFINKKEIHI